MLGAVALGDIGKLYPDNDDRFLNIDSRILLRDAYEKVKEKGFVLINADITIIAQAPKMLPHIQQMRCIIAEDLKTDIDNINVKATTTEKLGFTGRKEGIAAEACVLVSKE